MKRIILITILIVGLTAAYGFADMGGHMDSGQGMMGGQSHQQTGDSGYPCQHMMGGGMMGQGHMGGMMGGGMMGQGHMGSGMMGEGMMGGYGYRGNDPEAYKKYQDEYNKYLDDTADLRRKLHNKRFEYSEAVRNPDTTRKSILKLEKEMIDLQWKIYEKAPGE